MALEPRSLGLIDAGSNDVVAEVALGVRPVAIAADGSMVWVVSDDGALVRVDPNRERVVRTLSLDVRTSDAALGPGALWLGDAEAQAVLRVDTAHDAVAARLTLSPPAARAAVFGAVAPKLALGGGFLWVSHGQSSVAALDPRTLAVRATIRPARGANAALAYGYGSLWVGGAPSWLTRIAPTESRVRSEIALEATPAAVAAGAGSVWVALPSAGKIARVHPETESVETIAVGGAPTALAVGRDSVWVVVPSAGAVLRIDAATGEVVAEIETGATPAALAVVGEAVWVAVT